MNLDGRIGLFCQLLLQFLELPCESFDCAGGGYPLPVWFLGTNRRFGLRLQFGNRTLGPLETFQNAGGIGGIVLVVSPISNGSVNSAASAMESILGGI
jgi:hypothetical protein